MENNILIISHNSFSNKLNNGKTLESIFSSFKKENLFQIYFRHLENLDFSYCENYLHLTPFKFNLNLISRNILIKQHNRKRFFIKFLDNKISLKYILIDLYWNIFFWNKKKIFKWCLLNNFKSIFFLSGQSLFSQKLALKISKEFNIPLFVYFTDDYLIYPVRSNLLDKFHKYRIEKSFKKLINNSIKCFAIGRDMCDEYSSFFKKEFTPLMNSIKFIDYPDPLYSFDLIISYFGTLHTNRWESLLDFSKIINKYNQNNKRKLFLNIYTSSILEEIELIKFNSKYVNFYKPVYGKQFEEKISNSNFLLHCESDKLQFKSSTKLSISTKIPEYSTTKRPIIAYGPSDISSIKLLDDNNLAFVFNSSENYNILLKKIELLFNIKMCNYIAKNAYQYAKENFDIVHNSLNFESIIIKETNNYYEKNCK
jgi:hypothetical protein